MLDRVDYVEEIQDLFPYSSSCCVIHPLTPLVIEFKIVVPNLNRGRVLNSSGMTFRVWQQIGSFEACG